MPQQPNSHRALVAAAVALLVGLIVWWFGFALDSEPANGAPAPMATNTLPSPVSAPVLVPETTLQRSAVDAPSAAASPPPAGATLTLRVRLRGLQPGAPWTASLGLRHEGRDEPNQTWLQHEEEQVPGPDGFAAFSVPAWLTTATRQKGRLVARDPNYLLLEHRWDGTLDLTQELVLDVQAAAVLQGRVVTARGEPVAPARVCAFAIVDGKPDANRLGMTNTRRDGSYHLRVPPGVMLLVVATPLQPLQLSGRGLTGEDGSIPDNGTVRDDLLPAAARTRSTLGAPAVIADLVLPDAAQVGGVVCWADEGPIAEARVWIHPDAGTALGIAEHTAVHALANGSFAPTAVVTTDGEGRFCLPAIPGAHCQLRIEAIAGVEIVGDHPNSGAIAPQQVRLHVPMPLTLRTQHNGTAVPRATIEVEIDYAQSATGRLRLTDLYTDDNGELRAVTTLPELRVRAKAAAQQSAWQTIATTPPRTIDLDLGAKNLGELAIEFTGDFPVRNVNFVWTRSDGATGHEHLLRDDSPGPFRLHLEAGHYQLRIGPAGGERNGLFLLPIEREVDVTATPQNLRLPAVFGGRFTVFATDSRGLYVAGTCRVLDGNGADRTVQFVCSNDDQGRCIGAPGELMAGGPNEFGAILPPGEYLLDFVFAEQGALQRRVTIKPREVTDVRLRLP